MIRKKEEKAMNVIDSYQVSTKPERTERIDRLYKYVTDSKYGICVERGKLITDYYRTHCFAL